MNKFIVSSSPHFQSKDTTQTLMLDVILALTPAMIASVIIFGFRAAVIILTTVASCILSEYISRRVMKRRQTVGDLSCVVTGVLLAMNLPVSISPIIAAFGGVIAIVVVKQMFGGIGQNFVNPALTARIILMNSFPAKMTAWTAPMDHSFSDAMTTATPLGVLSEGTGAALPELPRHVPRQHGRLPRRDLCTRTSFSAAFTLLHAALSARLFRSRTLQRQRRFPLLLGRDPLMDILSGGLLARRDFYGDRLHHKPHQLQRHASSMPSAAAC